MGKIRLLCLFFSLPVLLSSCGGKDKSRNIEEYVSAFLNENSSIAIFGKADAEVILSKIDYKAVPKFGFIVGSQIAEFKSLIKLDSPIFYALEAPYSEKGPSALYAFFEVLNTEGLVKNLTQKGYDFDLEDDIHYLKFDNISLGIRNDLAILIIKPEQYSVAATLTKAFKGCSGDVSTGHIASILKEKGDIVTGLNLNSLYSTSDTKLSKLDKQKKEEVAKMVEESFCQSVVNFEDGQIVVEMKNFFSPALNKILFFKSDQKASVLSKLGQGNARLGFSLNLDMRKLETFLEEFSPGGISQLSENLGTYFQLMLMAGGDKPLSGLFGGKAAVVSLGELGPSGSLVPHFNAFLGLGPKGKPLADKASGLLSSWELQTSIDASGISCFSSPKYAPVPGRTLKIPSGCEVFGKKAITGFIYLDDMDISSFDLQGGAKLLQLAKYITLEADENGAKICIKAKNGQENALKQSASFLLHEFEEKINGIHP
jgi:hypothetical protein